MQSVRGREIIYVAKHSSPEFTTKVIDYSTVKTDQLKKMQNDLSDEVKNLHIEIEEIKTQIIQRCELDRLSDDLAELGKKLAFVRNARNEYNTNYRNRLSYQQKMNGQVTSDGEIYLCLDINARTRDVLEQSADSLAESAAIPGQSADSLAAARNRIGQSIGNLVVDRNRPDKNTVGNLSEMRRRSLDIGKYINKLSVMTLQELEEEARKIIYSIYQGENNLLKRKCLEPFLLDQQKKCEIELEELGNKLEKINATLSERQANACCGLFGL